jgi:tRNA 5-methylaminomethyl-2-thiouridine biosynthesis bifunctional protein
VIEHADAGWIRPAALVRAWLAQPGIAWRGDTHVAALERIDGQWLLRDAQGQELGRAPIVVVAAATGSAALLGSRVALTPVRGQVSWGPRPDSPALPARPLNGNGHFLPDVPFQGERVWLSGSTYAREDTGLDVRAADHAANLARLAELAPEVAAVLAPQFDAGTVRAWTGVRCTSADRRPLVGEVDGGLWVSTALGSRGLTFAALCGELIAARLHGEALPLDAALAAALDISRPMGPKRAQGGRA